MRPFASSRAYAAMHYNCESTALNASKKKNSKKPDDITLILVRALLPRERGKKKSVCELSHCAQETRQVCYAYLSKHAKYAMRQVAAWLSC